MPHEGQFLICDSCGDIEIPGGDLAKQLSASPRTVSKSTTGVELSGLCGHCKHKPVQR